MTNLQPEVIRLGTRGSALALWQSNWVMSALEHRWPGLRVERITIKTTGDKIQNVPLAEVGGKGLFTKEIDEALLAGQIDVAVHSMKDIPYLLPNGIDFGAIPEREDPRDAFVSNGRTLGDLPPNAVIGTSSLRRQVQLRRRFPSIRLTPLRGNVDTRLKKVAAGEFDGIVLALAGLKRLGHENLVTQIIGEDLMLPAVGQGALGIACRTNDTSTRSLLETLDHAPSRLAVSAERGLLAALEGSCKVPVAGYATLQGDQITLRGLVANLTGSIVVADQISGTASQARELGLKLGKLLVERGAGEILAGINESGSPR
ncbi:MAG TPA: hydroxymethylbilane synthase [Terriglobia bacterium]|nr:hydroxymethylbilane synthase [Terriglobia bacterium]